MTEQGHALALKMPKGTIQFLQKNPKLAQQLGQLLAMSFEMNLPTEAIHKLLEKDEVILGCRTLVENGTEEEFTDFMVDVYKAVGEPQDLGVKTIEEMKEFEKQLGSDRFMTTEVKSVADMT